MGTKLLSASEQVAVRLRTELSRGRWSGLLPGIHKLSADFGYPRKPVERALVLLEREGWLEPQGVGKRRKIVPQGKIKARPMRVAVLDYDPAGLKESVMADLLTRLSDEGHAPFFAEKSLVELGMDVRRIARLVGKTDADIWIVNAAPAEVLAWFAAREIPTFSVFGGFANLPVAGLGVRYVPPMLEVTRKLLALGHRRIVYLAARGRIENPPGQLWQCLLDEIEAKGAATGAYNLPNWQDGAEGFHRMLGSLFAHTPPTVLVVEEIPHMFGVLQFCALRGIRVPGDLSLVCMTHGTDFDYCLPSMAHIRWDESSLLKRIVAWTNQTAGGKGNHRHTYIKAEFVDGGTVSPA